MFIPGQLIAILTFPGVIVHEAAHQLFCRFFSPGAPLCDGPAPLFRLVRPRREKSAPARHRWAVFPLKWSERTANRGAGPAPRRAARRSRYPRAGARGLTGGTLSQ
jgi:hypothetical protein